MTDRDDIIAFAIPEITDGDVAGVERVLRSGWLTTGDECAGLEAEVSAYLGGSEVISVSSGTAALDIALAHLDLAPGSRVGVPDWTFVATALAAVHNGLTPVLLDVEADTLNLSPEALAAEIDDLAAVVPVHFGGVPVDAEIHRIAADAGVPVVEDAAHALGASDERGRIGAPGTSPTCFSLYASKNLTSAEGGLLATDDPALAAFARSQRLHGMDADAWARYRPGARAGYDVVQPGIKANLPDVLAVLARSQFARFDATQARRRAISEQYRRILEAAGVELIPARPVDGSADHLMALTLPDGTDRDAVMSAMSAEGVSSSVHFRPLHQFSWFRDYAVIGRTGLGVCDELAERVMSLPLHVNLRDADVERVCDTFLRALSAQAGVAVSPYLRVRIVVDRVVAAIVLVALSPVVAVLGWLVHRHDGGPAFITVERVGRGGRPIRMWKLRSMRSETSDGRASGVSLTSADDDRITPIGAKLRAGHLDELPQLFNVVKGEMALLGPRPEAPEFVDGDDDGWRAVLAAPPGIAGPTQLVVGDWEREIITASPDGSAYERDVVPVKVAIDRWYVESASATVDAMVAIGLAQHLLGRMPAPLLERVHRCVPVARSCQDPLPHRGRHLTVVDTDGPTSQS